MSKFKIILFPALFLLLIAFTTVKSQQVNPDSLLLEERAYYYKKYKSVRDTMTINTWLNLKRVSDNLEQVVKRDQQVIDVLKQKILSDSVKIVDLKKVLNNNERLSAKKGGLEHRNTTEAIPVIYLKAAVAVLLFLCIIMLYFLISRYNKLKKLRSSNDHYENIVMEKMHQLENMDAELRRMKQRELDFRDELERGMQLNQEKLLSLQEKCGQLADENHKLRINRKTATENTNTEHPDISVNSELPDNMEELKRMVKSLIEERNSLMNLAGKLRTQNEEEKRKNHEILNKISFLLKDLSDDKP